MTAVAAVMFPLLLCGVFFFFFYKPYLTLLQFATKAAKPKHGVSLCSPANSLSPSSAPPFPFPPQEMKICSAIINLFHLIPAAPQTLVKPLLEVVMKTERAMLIEVPPAPPSHT